jgi:hypothetical protein
MLSAMAGPLTKALPVKNPEPRPFLDKDSVSWGGQSRAGNAHFLTVGLGGPFWTCSFGMPVIWEFDDGNLRVGCAGCVA